MIPGAVKNRTWYHRIEQRIELTAEQIALIEKNNPCFRERHVESSRPGELLSQDTFYVGRLKGVGRVYLHTVVDTFGSYAFSFLHNSKQPEAAVAVLHNDVLPFYTEQGIPVLSKYRPVSQFWRNLRHGSSTAIVLDGRSNVWLTCRAAQAQNHCRQISPRTIRAKRG